MRSRQSKKTKVVKRRRESSRPALGTKCFLLRRFSPHNEFFIRIYHYDEKDKQGHPTFTDYEIDHCDLEICITDRGARFFEGSHPSIDYPVDVVLEKRA